MLTNPIVNLVFSVSIVLLPVVGVLFLVYVFWRKNQERKEEALHSKFGEDANILGCFELESIFEENRSLFPELLLERLLKIWTPRQMRELGSAILLWESADGNLHLSWYKEGRLFEERYSIHQPHFFHHNPKIGVISHDLLLTLDLKLIPDQPSSD